MPLPCLNSRVGQPSADHSARSGIPALVRHPTGVSVLEDHKSHLIWGTRANLWNGRGEKSIVSPTKRISPEDQGGPVRESRSV